MGGRGAAGQAHRLEGSHQLLSGTTRFPLWGALMLPWSCTHHVYLQESGTDPQRAIMPQYNSVIGRLSCEVSP